MVIVIHGPGNPASSFRVSWVMRSTLSMLSMVLIWIPLVDSHSGQPYPDLAGDDVNAECRADRVGLVDHVFVFSAETQLACRPPIRSP